MARILLWTAIACLAVGPALGTGLADADIDREPMDRAFASPAIFGDSFPATPRVRSSSTDVQTFTSREAWEAAAGGLPDFRADFNGFLVDTSFAPPVDLGPFTVEHHGGLVSGGRSKVDVSPFDFGSSVDGTPYASLFVDDRWGLYVDLTFDTPVRAFGADWYSAGNRTPLRITAFDADGTRLFDLHLFSLSRVFFGFVTEPRKAATRIRLGNPFNDGVGVDNIAAYSGGATPFASFDVHFASVEFDATAGAYDGYAFGGVLEAAEGGDGLDLLHDAVTVGIGDSKITIPPESFVIDGAGYVYEGVVADAMVRASFRELDVGTYGFGVDVTGVDLAGSTNVVGVELVVGDEFGQVTARLSGRLRFRGDGTIPRDE